MSDWKDLIEIEPLLIKNAKSKDYDSNKNIKGGTLENNKKYSKFKNIETLKYIIILKILSKLDYILIGSWAINLIEMGLQGGNIKQSYEKIQLITQDSIEITFQTLKDKIKGFFPDYLYEISYKEHNLCLPKEYRATRYTVYIKIPCSNEGECPIKEKPIIDIFINGTYELIPWISANRFLKRKNIYYPKHIKIGNPYVLLRFLLIDLWIIRILFIKGIMLKNTYEIKIKKIWIMILKIRNKNKLCGIINKAFGLDNYIGIYSNEYIYFKNLIKGKYIATYNPTSYKKEHKSYRTV